MQLFQATQKLLDCKQVPKLFMSQNDDGVSGFSVSSSEDFYRKEMNKNDALIKD